MATLDISFTSLFGFVNFTIFRVYIDGVSQGIEWGGHASIELPAGRYLVRTASLLSFLRSNELEIDIREGETRQISLKRNSTYVGMIVLCAFGIRTISRMSKRGELGETMALALIFALLAAWAGSIYYYRNSSMVLTPA